MTELQQPLSAIQLSRMSGAALSGNPDVLVSRLGALSELSKGVLSFLTDRTMLKTIANSHGGVVFCDPLMVPENSSVTFLLVKEPKLAFSKFASAFGIRVSDEGISSSAQISPSAQLDSTVTVGPFSVIGAGVRIGKGTKIAAHVYLGEGVILGDHCEIFPRVVIMESVRVGNRVRIFPGAVIGSAGFGFFESPTVGGLVEMPQIGTVVIEDDVRIGANSTIDRATLGVTHIGKGVKIDNLVHVAHNCKLGRYSILCGQVGVSGSVTLGDGVMLGGQVGIGDGVTIGAGAQLGGQTGVSSDIPGGKAYRGTPPVPVNDFFRNHIQLRKLPEILKRLRRLEKKTDPASAVENP